MSFRLIVELVAKSKRISDVSPLLKRLLTASEYCRYETLISRLRGVLRIGLARITGGPGGVVFVTHRPVLAPLATACGGLGARVVHIVRPDAGDLCR